MQAPFWQAGFLTKPKQFPHDHPYLAVMLGSLCMRPDAWLFSCLSPSFLACVWAGALLYWDLPSPNSCWSQMQLIWGKSLSLSEHSKK